MSARWPWSELGLTGKADLREIKRAYSVRLKQIDRNDPDAFQRLRDAFAQAKYAAPAADKPAQKKRPSMTEIARGEMSIEVPPAPKPSPAADPVEPEPFDDTPIEMPEPVATEAQQEPEDRDPVRPAPQPDPPAPRAPAKPINPWGAATDDLDALAEENLNLATAEFWKKFNAAIAKWPWNTDALDRLLSLDMAHELWLRKDAERSLYNSLLENITDYGRGFPRQMAMLIDTHFAWSSDGVGVQKRLGYLRDYALMMHAFSVSRPASKTKPDSMNIETRSFRFYKCGVFIILLMFSLSQQPRISDLDELFIQGAALGIMLFLVHLGVRLIVKSAARVSIVIGISRLIRKVFARVFPKTDADLARSPNYRAFATFVLSALVVASFFLFGDA